MCNLFVLICLFIMATNKNITIDELRSILDEKFDLKLMPLNDKITDLNNKLEETMKFLDTESLILGFKVPKYGIQLMRALKI